MSRLRPHRHDRGAAAVEFALILPVLLLLLVGIIEFGLAFNTQVSLTQALREGVRVEALELEDVDGDEVTRNAFLAVGADSDNLSIQVTTCEDAEAETGEDEDPRARVAGQYPYEGIILGFLGLTRIELSNEAVMRCGG